MEKRKNTDIVAKYCANFKYEDIPEDVLKITKQVFLDTIGIMLGSVDLDKGRFGIELAEEIGGGQDECIRRVREAGYQVTVEPKDVVIPSEVPFALRVAFCVGPLGEEIEFLQEK